MAADRAGALDRAAKRAVDVALSAIGLGLLLPAWGLLALAIKLEDGGPVFFAQERWGEGQRTIRVRKFRSMAVHAADRAVQAVAGDRRITRVGRLMRATALDESPQLLNIFMGEMSFVGPRVLPINEIQARERDAALPDDAIPGFELRCAVPPGLTGLAQLYAPRDVPRRQKFRYDSLYVRRRSVWLDLRLIALSIFVSITGQWQRRGDNNH
ncbi:MAG TPA: sugar transferase [Methylomirabilota bacterium]|nr:sugar transferase [Methylomirabilota bacterium]